MNNSEWIQDCIIEMINDIKIDITDDISDRILELSNDISDGITESYFQSGDYVADCNFKSYKKSEANSEIEALRKKIELLESFILSKGYEFKVTKNNIYEIGMEHVGGTVWASYEKLIK